MKCNIEPALISLLNPNVKKQHKLTISQQQKEAHQPNNTT
jgi:hypothetical protein